MSESESKNGQDLTDEQVLEKIKMILSEETDTNPEDIKEETTLADGLDMDRNSIQQVLVACEVEFGVTYEVQDADDIKTVGDLVRSVTDWL